MEMNAIHLNKVQSKSKFLKWIKNKTHMQKELHTATDGFKGNTTSKLLPFSDPPIMIAVSMYQQSPNS